MNLVDTHLLNQCSWKKKEEKNGPLFQEQY
jgi:hypothetical protein